MVSIDHRDWDKWLEGTPGVLNLNWIVLGLPESKLEFGSNEELK